MPSFIDGYQCAGVIALLRARKAGSAPGAQGADYKRQQAGQQAGHLQPFAVCFLYSMAMANSVARAEFNRPPNRQLCDA